MTALRCWTRRGVLAVVATVPLLLQAQASQARTVSASSTVTPLVGMVRDSVGRPVMGVELRLKGSTVVLARTADNGGFRIPSMPVGASSIALRRLGFAPATIEVRLRAGVIDSVVVSMSALPAYLAEMAVIDDHDVLSKRILAGFWERRKNGFGHFMTRDEIERTNTSEFADLVRTIPGVQLVMTNGGRRVIRFSRSTLLRDCPPQYVVDGMRIENGSPDEFAPGDVEAIEIYAGTATIPLEFRSGPYSRTCGAVVIWTRLPG